MKVYILESLLSTDPQAGKEVYDKIKAKGIDTDFSPIRSRDDFVNALRRICVETSLTHIKPIVHLDFHGNPDGLGIVDAADITELLTWADMRELFRELYLQSRMRSIVCMSSCKGVNVAKLVAHGEPCPYESISGCFEDISFPDSVSLYTALYSSLNSGKEFFDSCVELANSADYKHMKFIGVNAYTLFKVAIDGYIRLECTDEQLAQKRELYKQAFREIGLLSPQAEALIDQSFTLENQKAILEGYATRFFS